MTTDDTRGGTAGSRARRWLLAFGLSLAFYLIRTIIDPPSGEGTRMVLHFVIVVTVCTVLTRFLILGDRGRFAGRTRAQPTETTETTGATESTATETTGAGTDAGHPRDAGDAGDAGETDRAESRRT